MWSMLGLGGSALIAVVIGDLLDRVDPRRDGPLLRSRAAVPGESA